MTPKRKVLRQLKPDFSEGIWLTSTFIVSWFIKTELQRLRNKLHTSPHSSTGTRLYVFSPVTELVRKPDFLGNSAFPTSSVTREFYVTANNTLKRQRQQQHEQQQQQQSTTTKHFSGIEEWTAT